MPIKQTRNPSRTTPPGKRGEQQADLLVDDGGDERADNRTDPQRNRLPQRKAEVAQAQAAHQPAKAPEGAEQRTAHAMLLARAGAEDAPEIRRREQSGDRRHDDPGDEAQRDPIGFPGPLLDLVGRDIEACRGEAACSESSAIPRNCSMLSLSFGWTRYAALACVRTNRVLTATLISAFGRMTAGQPPAASISMKGEASL